MNLVLNSDITNQELQKAITEKNELERALASVSDILQNTVVEKD